MNAHHRDERIQTIDARADGQGAAVRAVVGSLVLCAVIGSLTATAPTAAHAQNGKGPRVNTAPLRDLLAKARRMQPYGGLLDPVETFEMTVEAERASDGTLSNARISTTPALGAGLHALAEEFVTALSDSRLLHVFDDARQLQLNIRLDQQTLAGSLAFEAATPERAAELARGYNVLLTLGRLRGGPREVVLNNMTVSSSGKQLSMRLEMSREAAGNLLQKLLPPN